MAPANGETWAKKRCATMSAPWRTAAMRSGRLARSGRSPWAARCWLTRQRIAPPARAPGRVAGGAAGGRGLGDGGDRGGRARVAGGVRSGGDGQAEDQRERGREEGRGERPGERREGNEGGHAPPIGRGENPLHTNEEGNRRTGERCAERLHASAERRFWRPLVDKCRIEGSPDRGPGPRGGPRMG